MKLLVLTMLGQLLQQNILVNRDFIAGGPCHVLTMELAICKIHRWEEKEAHGYPSSPTCEGQIGQLGSICCHHSSIRTAESNIQTLCRAWGMSNVHRGLSCTLSGCGSSFRETARETMSFLFSLIFVVRTELQSKSQTYTRDAHEVSTGMRPVAPAVSAF